ncbi:xorIIM [Symbiodinium natans]|uniref:XorIIM protein n=1 Tax=Symbiodinium natans TaxID=878477 RepID=A0A812QGB0_9DINO|nr:xorIIM [Symbiodinium natans]
MSDQQRRRFGILRSAVLRARKTWLEKSELPGHTWPEGRVFTCATDCSGLEAPLFGMKLLGLQFRQCWGSDIDENARRWIRAQGMCPLLFHNAIERRLPEHVEPCCLDGYWLGFPCQPFSAASVRARGFQDKRTEVLRAGLRAMMHARPFWAVLENVKGIVRARHQKGFKKMLTQEGITDHYAVAIARICPHANLREPIRRPRVFFLCTRKDCALTDDQNLVKELLQNVCAEVQGSLPPAELEDYLRDVVKKEDVGRENKGKQGAPTEKKWVEQHGQVREQLGLPYLSDMTELSRKANHLPGLTLRQQSLVEIKTHGLQKHDYPVILDVSQSLGRAPMLSGVCPCLTRGAQPVMISGDGRGRLLSSHECLALMGFPLSMTTMPTSVGDAALHALAGNSMHITSIALATMLAISLVNWEATGRGDAPPVLRRLSCKTKVTTPLQQVTREVESSGSMGKKKQRIAGRPKIKRRLSDIFSRVPASCAVRKPRPRRAQHISSTPERRSSASSASIRARTPGKAVAAKQPKRRLSDIYES